ncbi:dihydroorotate dehydrogenase [Ignicoccus islandicus DSM 13165]|uniref:Dihydroorotate dehydrogenase n=1 Tax=Ignicoccus islandicus DSM 13165 TaxID=940295 RepID=A0A0U3F5K3_9CREN|nr:divalent-cation tolerance protein CutA [Ignicoccus islandicus]ALU11352.1 dihydroorotate dehydrogenase [Ignicoccus islandicus DSM 13165]
MIIISTLPNREDAKKIARTLVEKRLVACAWVLGEIQSFYIWKDQLQEDEETVLVLKVPKEKASEAINELRNLHPYEVPEIIAVEADYVLPEYLKWAKEVCEK